MKLREFWIDDSSLEDLYAMHFAAPVNAERTFVGIHVIEAAPALAALTAAESALLDASYALSDGSPARREVLAALKLVRDTLGVGPRWLDPKPKKG